jgi:hypothetical protein
MVEAKQSWWRFRLPGGITWNGILVSNEEMTERKPMNRWLGRKTSYRRTGTCPLALMIAYES